MLTLWQSNRLERLADALADVVRVPAAGALVPETIVVQNAGMKRWLALQLAQRLGISANEAFEFPAKLVWEVFRSVLPDVPEASSLEPEATTWAIMGLLARLDRSPGHAPVHDYLGSSEGDVRRYELARRLADVFAQYVVFRPDWVRAWEEGRPAGLSSPEARRDELWQSELWRSLVSPPARARHFASLEAELHARLRRAAAAPSRAAKAKTAGTGQLGLFDTAPSSRAPHEALQAMPRRLSLFGIPAMPPPVLEVFHRLSEHLDVHLFLLNPSRAYWFDIRTKREQLRESARAGGIAQDLLHRDVGNSLLASLGRQSRDFIGSLLAWDDETVRHREIFETPGAAQDAQPTLLETLQADLLDLRERGERPGARDDGEDDRFPPPTAIGRDDRSLSIHVCHSPVREVEVLHDRLLDLFERQPDLRPADVVVMTPEIERYAPAIEAVFSTAPPERRIPYSIADRRLSAASPLVAAFLGVLDLPGSRFDANRVLDLLQLSAVQRRFEIEPGEVERMQRWVRETNVRWGIDESTPASLELPASREHTWAFGLDRLLLGHAMAGADDGLFAGILPYDEIEGADARAVGRLAAFTRAVFDVELALAAPRSLADWSRTLGELLDRLFLPDDDEEIAVHAIRGALAKLEQIAALPDVEGAVSLETMRIHLREALDASAGTDPFLAGRVTFCALVPMRSIPFAVVCLIGMNDGSFPRSHRAPSFDLIAREPRHGDRSRREDDRYLFLEALLSARRHLHVSYVGRSLRDNSEIPPSVLVSELLDTVKRSFYSSEDEGLTSNEREERLRERLVLEHPLQPFSHRYFEGDERLFSYASELCEATVASRERHLEPLPFLRAPLPAPEDEDWRQLDVERLARFFQNPARGFIERRLAVRLREAEGLVETVEPFRLAGLEAYSARGIVLDHVLAGVPHAESAELLRAAGLLPHGALGEGAYDALLREVAPYAARVRQLLPGEPPPPVPVGSLEIGGLRLGGALTLVTESGRIEMRPGKMRAADRIMAWVRHLVQCVLHSRGELPARASCVTRVLALDHDLTLQPVADAEERLCELAELFGHGLREPLPFFPASAWTYVEKLERSASDPVEAARKVFSSGDASAESENRYVQLAFRGVDPIDSRFADLARTIVSPLRRAMAPEAP